MGRRAREQRSWQPVGKAGGGRGGSRLRRQDKEVKREEGGVKDGSGSGHKFAWIEYMRAWACEECGKVKRVARHKTDMGTCRVKEISQAGADRLKDGGGMHSSHCIWKGWGKEGHPPTNICVKCGCFSTFRCVNLKTVCKGSFSSEAARKRVGWGLSRIHIVRCRRS